MDKRRIKTATTQELLEELIATAIDANISKRTEEIGAAVCVELKRRGIIEDSFGLFRKWRR